MSSDSVNLHAAHQPVSGGSPAVLGGILTSMYVGYAFFMVLRMAPAAVATAIQSDLGMTEGDWGRIMGVSTAGAVLGKFIGGYMADRLGGRFTFSAGLVLCGLGTIGFGCVRTIPLFQLMFFLALLAKSFGWPGMTRIVGACFRPPVLGRVWGLLSTSSRVGTLLATLGLGALIATVSWHNVLLVAGGLGCVVGVGFYVSQLLLARRLSTGAGDGSAMHAVDPAEAAKDSETVPSDHPLSGTSLPQGLWQFFCSGQFWLITISLAGMTILWDFLLMLPLYLKSELGFSDSGATMLSSAFPAGSLVAVFGGGFLFDALSSRRRAWSMGTLLAVAAGCLGVFLAMPAWSLSDDSVLQMTAVVLFVFGMCIAPCYYIPMSIYSIRTGGPHAGFLVSLLDALAFAVTGVFYWYGGEVAEGNWQVFLSVLAGIALLSAACMLVFLLGEPEQPQAVPV